MKRNTGKRIDLDLTSHEDYLIDAKQVLNGIPFDEVDEDGNIIIPEDDSEDATPDDSLGN